MQKTLEPIFRIVWHVENYNMTLGVRSVVYFPPDTRTDWTYVHTTRVLLMYTYKYRIYYCTYIGTYL